MRLKNLIAVVGVLTASILLSACGNDSSDKVSQNSGKPSTDDAFITTVRVQTDGSNAMSDEAEPIDIMAINATSPEEKEPQAVNF